MAIAVGLGFKQPAITAFFPSSSPLHSLSLLFTPRTFLPSFRLPFLLHFLPTSLPPPSTISSAQRSWPCLPRSGHGRYELSQKQGFAAFSSLPGGRISQESRRLTMVALAETMASEKDIMRKKDKDLSERALWRPSIDFKWIRDNKDSVADNISNRKATADVENVVQLYERSCQIRGEVDKLRAERNMVASAMKGKLEVSRREELIEQGKQLKERLAGLEDQLTNISDLLYQEGQRIPNTTHPSAPVGPEENAVLRKQALTGRCPKSF